jgi:hypothetical protein
MQVVQRLFAAFLVIVVSACLTQRAAGENCITQAQMDAPTRDTLVKEALAAGKALLSGDPAAIADASAPDFVAAAQSNAGPLTRAAHGASLTVDALWILEATDVAANQQNAQFFCGIANAPAHSTFIFSSLPPSRYAVVFLHATGISAPQQIALVLKDVGGAWKIAGFSFRPLTLAGHDALWYWSQARDYAKKKQLWNAYFYYATAAYLATPAAYISTGNLEKLVQEQEASAPPDLPRPGHPLVVAGASGQFQVTDVSTDGSLGGLDLVLRYSANDVSDPAATRQKNIELMRAMLTLHPELQSAFHGLWVYAVAPGQSPFGIELPMSEIH